MRESIANSIMNTVRDLNKSGIVDDITMRNIEKLCLPEVKDYPPEKIIAIRKRFKSIYHRQRRWLVKYWALKGATLLLVE